jgi:acyl-CoA hydrolase
MDARPSTDSRATLVKWMGLADANSAGYPTTGLRPAVPDGGVAMKLCDEAAGIAAIKHSRRRVVTAGMDRMTFLFPVHVGELVTFSASVNAVWRTSMEVGVRVDSENPRTGEHRHTNTAYLTMVALDEDGAPTRVPPLAVDDPTEERRAREAQVRRSNRLAEREQILSGRG